MVILQTRCVLFMKLTITEIFCKVNVIVGRLDDAPRPAPVQAKFFACRKILSSEEHKIIFIEVGVLPTVGSRDDYLSYVQLRNYVQDNDVS